ncbi:hypothetical protein [Mycolicibacterium brisbanense]|uniref:Uncharacterized protein n=1 Tax=Mycolicibacterium brisbanense TaxID=146020 RepID=A0A100W6Z2_9MYCO|nr:hypothetical protein [Mycolicibacterium brisbanense]MCV7158022.1 hypothetical protein [Mycolicibacterium brisbanense]GAS92671.1 uncharacterized protein RMCB_6767 [Mycolicibacterium brisbanense]
MDDIVQGITNAAKLASTWEPNHPQYVEGTLYLTQAQWDAVREQFPPTAERRHMSTHHAWGIPIKIISPNTAEELPSGRTLVYSAALESFYVFDRAEAAGSYRIQGSKLTLEESCKPS